MHTETKLAMLIVMALGVGSIAAQDAQQVDRYISVTGMGTVSTMPDTMELFGVVRGEGELAGDALTQFLAVAQAAGEKLKGLGIEGLAVSTQGLNVGESVQGRSTAELLMATRSGREAEPPKVRVSERVDIHLTGIDQLDRDKLLAAIVKIVDAGTEAGLSFGKPKSEMDRIRSDPDAGYLQFRLVGTEQAQSKAREQAMQAARTNAQKLADLAGVKLGRVLSIEESSTSSLPSSLRPDPNTSPNRAKIDVSVSVRVKYELLQE